MLQEGYMLRVNNIGSQQHLIRAKIEELVGPEATRNFYHAWLSNHTRRIDIDSMSAWGFNSVRLPMHYNLYTLPIGKEPVAGQNTWLDEGFAMTDSLLKWCSDNHMYLILDLHAAPGGQGNDLAISDRDETEPSLWQSQANQDKMIALWKKLAERYSSSPWLGAYDIINEPNWGFESADDHNGCSEKKNEPLKALMVSITKAIREVDKNHMIIVEGNCWGNNYTGILPLWDTNMALSFHKYWNYNDTKSIQQFLDLRKQYAAPIWLGESGENSDVWFRDAIRLLEDNKIGWCWWPLKKLGFNNPLEIVAPDGYLDILAYWSGSAPAPNREAAIKGLMDLADNAKLENCFYHKEVIDAMFRQVRTTETIPYHWVKVSPGDAIEAVDFDLGRNGFAYSDHDVADYHIAGGGNWVQWNHGSIFRNDGVDIDLDFDPTIPLIVNLDSGEWMQYTFVMEIPGEYMVSLNRLPYTPSSSMDIIKGGKKFVAAPKTIGSVLLPAVTGPVHFGNGVQTFRVCTEEGGVRLRSIEFLPVIAPVTNKKHASHGHHGAYIHSIHHSVIMH